MDLMETLYYLCLSVEENYNRQLMATFHLKTATLKETLQEIFGNFKSEKAADRKARYNVDSLKKEVAKDIINKWTNLDLLDMSKVKKMMYATINGKNTTQNDWKGWLDETSTMDAISDAMKHYSSTEKLGENSVDKIDSGVVSITYTGGDKTLGADFEIDISKIFMMERPVEGSAIPKTDVMKTTHSIIPFENKLHLDKFHITSGGKVNINSYLEDYDILKMFNIKQQIYDLIEQDIEGEIEPAFEINLDKDKFEYWVFMALVFDKISKKVPIFVTTEKGKIQYKLCSELVSDFSSLGKWKQHKGNTFFNYNTPITVPLEQQGVSEDMMKQIGKKMIKNINSYQLWYSK